MDAKIILTVGLIAVLAFLVISSVAPSVATSANDTFNNIDSTNFASAKTSWQNSTNWLFLGIGLLVLIALVAVGIKFF